MHLWKERYDQRRAMCQGLTSLCAVKLWNFHRSKSNKFFFSVFVLVPASNGTLLKLHCSLCSLNAADVWQHFDVKQPQAKLWLEMQQMTICNPHSYWYCIYSPHLERREWQSVRLLFSLFFFSFGGKKDLLFMTGFAQTSAKPLCCWMSSCIVCFPEYNTEVLRY